MDLPSWDEVYDGVEFGDLRRNKRMIETAKQVEHITEKKGVSATLRGHSELKAVSRAMHSKDINPMNITEGFIRHTCGKISAPHVLMVEDTTELNFMWRKIPIKGLGPAGNGEYQGFFLHTSIIVEPEMAMVLGLAGLSMYTREYGVRKREGEAYKRQSIEEKESYRWITVPREGCEHIPENSIKTIVGDREADIYELFLCHYNNDLGQNSQLLIRAGRNRKVNGGENFLFDEVSSWKRRGSHKVSLESTNKRKARVASCSIRYGQITMDVPKLFRTKSDKKGKIGIPDISVIEILEENPPKGEKGIHWVLLTTWSVKTLDEAIEKIEWYRCRWLIEEIFRVLKSGYETESARFNDGHALMNWCAMRLMMAVKVVYLKTSRTDETPGSARKAFNQEEIEILEACESDLISPKSTIHRPLAKSIAWATLLVAILGGYKATPSSKPPGQVCLWRGLARLEGAVIGYRAAKKNVGRT